MLSSVLAFAAALRLLGPPAVISGHLDHAPAGDSVRLYYGRHYQQGQVKAPLSSSGDFKLVLNDLTDGTPITFKYAGQQTSVYLGPGDDLHLALDFLRFDETVRYTGRNANVNNYLAQSLYKFAYGPAGSVPRPQDQRTETTTPEQMRQFADAFRQQQRSFLTAYAKAHPLPADFKQDVGFQIDLQWANTLLDYPEYYRSAAHQAAALPASYFDFIKLLPLKTIAAYAKEERGIDENTLLIRFLNGYSQYLVPSGNLSPDPAEAPKLYAKATADFGPTYARDQVMYLLFTRKLEKNLAGVEAAYPTFKAQNRDSAFAQALRTNLRKQQLMRPGQPAPAFTLVNSEGKQVSLSDFRGKVVYLDFWGTWCKPCMNEMPVSAQLRKRFAGRDVVFVYVSVGDKEDKWKQVLANEHFAETGAVHLRSTPESAVPVDYQVQYYPSYRLIGRDGKILLSPAPRPSAGDETVAVIENALKN
ncbi:MAG: TlpA family protein disulfide reductase [Janthinobacterium lividum]